MLHKKNLDEYFLKIECHVDKGINMLITKPGKGWCLTIQFKIISLQEAVI